MHSERQSDTSVVVERDGAMATVWLNRPTAHNALSEAVLLQLGEAFEQLADEPRGAGGRARRRGPAFCAGHDLREMRAAARPAWHRELFARCAAMMQAIRRCRSR